MAKGDYFTTTIKKEIVDGLLEKIKEVGGVADSLPKAIQWLVENWDAVIKTEGEEDREKEELKQKIKELEDRIMELEYELEEKNELIESLRNQDPKIDLKLKTIEAQKEMKAKELEVRKLELEIRRKQIETKAAVDIFKALCKSGKLPETICEAEMGEFIRDKLGLKRFLEGGQ